MVAKSIVINEVFVGTPAPANRVISAEKAAALSACTVGGTAGSLAGHTHAGGLPTGVILLWHRSIQSIPDGRLPCNGENSNSRFARQIHRRGQAG